MFSWGFYQIYGGSHPEVFRKKKLKISQNSQENTLVGDSKTGDCLFACLQSSDFVKHQ